ncbi:kinase-like protein [Phlegmacium glaucopus]|nr:kinase-like protein [Phlegmacium glaucopus]
MFLPWQQRKARLASLLKSCGDEEADGIALDRLMHGQSVIGKTTKTTEIDALRFQDKDLNVIGTLEYGQFGVIDVVSCHLNNGVYIRKSVEKRFALRTRDQCSPQFERNILLQALKTDSRWAPHLLCAFQTPTHLNLVMDYAEGGTLWHVLESSPHDGRIPESDLRWWAPQIVSAIHWCHSQGFAHRDIKPHNFVLTPDAHVLLIDFGSAAPLLPPNADGSQSISKQYCLVPCGTCDYISPEILLAHEEALLALEMDDDDKDDLLSHGSLKNGTEGYGVETDWWSLGAMLYEMAYGVAPFFANDIRQTYIRIMNHEKSLRFDQKAKISHEYQHFLRRLLTNAKQRLGRRNVMEITDHPLFDGVDWRTLPNQVAPAGLHLPQFIYAEPNIVPKAGATGNDPPTQYEEPLSQGYPFSAFFQPSSSVSPGLSVVGSTPGPAPAGGVGNGNASNNVLSSSLSSAAFDSTRSASSFIGFSWGPLSDAFPPAAPTGSTDREHGTENRNTHPTLIPVPIRGTPVTGLYHGLSVPTSGPTGGHIMSTPRSFANNTPYNYSTPCRPYAFSPHHTLQRTSTIRRSNAPRRSVSDREAMKQLVDCVGMSARKRVLDSGRKPRVIGVWSLGGKSSIGGEGMRRHSYKELRFDPLATPIPRPDYSALGPNSETGTVNTTRSYRNNSTYSHASSNDDHRNNQSRAYTYNYASSEGTNTDSEDGTGGPPSPSPSPRPGSAMSMISMSRRSGTPTTTAMLTMSGSLHNSTATGTLTSNRAGGNSSVTGTGYLSIPSTTSAGMLNLDFRLGIPPGGSASVVGGNVVNRTAGLAIPPTRPRSNVESQQQSESLPRAVFQSGHEGNPSQDPDDNDEPGCNAPGVTQSQSQWGSVDELERRHAMMMGDIEDLEERFQGLNASLMDDFR